MENPLNQQQFPQEFTEILQKLSKNNSSLSQNSQQTSSQKTTKNQDFFNNNQNQNKDKNQHFQSPSLSRQNSLQIDSILQPKLNLKAFKSKQQSVQYFSSYNDLDDNTLNNYQIQVHSPQNYKKLSDAIQAQFETNNYKQQKQIKKKNTSYQANLTEREYLQDNNNLMSSSNQKKRAMIRVKSGEKFPQGFFSQDNEKIGSPQYKLSGSIKNKSQKISEKNEEKNIFIAPQMKIVKQPSGNSTKNTQLNTKNLRQNSNISDYLKNYQNSNNINHKQINQKQKTLNSNINNQKQQKQLNQKQLQLQSQLKQQLISNITHHNNNNQNIINQNSNKKNITNHKAQNKDIISNSNQVTKDINRRSQDNQIENQDYLEDSLEISNKNYFDSPENSTQNQFNKNNINQNKKPFLSKESSITEKIEYQKNQKKMQIDLDLNFKDDSSNSLQYESVTTQQSGPNNLSNNNQFGFESPINSLSKYNNSNLKRHSSKSNFQPQGQPQGQPQYLPPLQMSFKQKSTPFDQYYPDQSSLQKQTIYNSKRATTAQEVQKKSSLPKIALNPKFSQDYQPFLNRQLQSQGSQRGFSNNMLQKQAFSNNNLNLQQQQGLFQQKPAFDNGVANLRLNSPSFQQWSSSTRNINQIFQNNEKLSNFPKSSKVSPNQQSQQKQFDSLRQTLMNQSRQKLVNQKLEQINFQPKINNQVTSQNSMQNSINNSNNQTKQLNFFSDLKQKDQDLGLFTFQLNPNSQKNDLNDTAKFLDCSEEIDKNQPQTQNQQQDTNHNRKQQQDIKQLSLEEQTEYQNDTFCNQQNLNEDLQKDDKKQQQEQQNYDRQLYRKNSQQGNTSQNIKNRIYKKASKQMSEQLILKRNSILANSNQKKQENLRQLKPHPMSASNQKKQYQKQEKQDIDLQNEEIQHKISEQTQNKQMNESSQNQNQKQNQFSLAFQQQNQQKELNSDSQQNQNQKQKQKLQQPKFRKVIFKKINKEEETDQKNQ